MEKGKTSRLSLKLKKKLLSLILIPRSEKESSALISSSLFQIFLTLNLPEYFVFKLEKKKNEQQAFHSLFSEDCKKGTDLCFSLFIHLAPYSPYFPTVKNCLLFVMWYSCA